MPTYLLNARLSARSLRGYRLLAPLIGRALRTVAASPRNRRPTRERFIELGARAGTGAPTWAI